MNRTILVFVVFSLGFAFAVALSIFLWLPENEQSKSLQPDDETVVSQGELLYRGNCAECHGQNLEGQPNWRSRDAEGYLPAPPHDESGHTWHHTDKLLFAMTKDGIASIVGSDYMTRMPAYVDVLSDEEVIAVLSFIKSRWPKQIRKRHDKINEVAKNR